MKFNSFLTSTFLALIAVLGFATRSAHAMTISPPDFNITVNPGDVIRDVLHVYNEDPFPVTLKPSLLNFTFSPGDETGTSSPIGSRSKTMRRSRSAAESG
jgi:hypothetical protein